MRSFPLHNSRSGGNPKGCDQPRVDRLIEQSSWLDQLDIRLHASRIEARHKWIIDGAGITSRALQSPACDVRCNGAPGEEIDDGAFSR